MSLQNNRPTRREQRAAFYLWLYLRLGPDRSLRKLAEFCSSPAAQAAHPGIAISESTLFAYSRDFNWAAAVEDYEWQVNEHRQQVLIEDAIADAADDMSLVKLLKNAGRYTLEAKIGQRLLEDPDDDEAMPVEPLRDTAAIRAIVDGVKLGRLLSGEATEISQVMLGVYDNVGRAVSDIFLDAVTAYERTIRERGDSSDETLQLARNEATGIWGGRLNSVIIEHFRVIGVQDVEVG